MIRVDVRAQQPLHLGARPDVGWLTDTHRFVPGSVLRGALATVWLAHHRPPRHDVTGDAEFLQLFESAVRFGPLYPGEDALRPLSVYGCKYADHFAHDAAFDGRPPEQCPACKSQRPACESPVEASKGRIEGTQVVEHTRVELDAHGRAKDGQLHTRRALAAGSRLTGLIDGEVGVDLSWLTEADLPVRLGGRRSTSGLATLTARPEAPPSSFTGFRPDHGTLVVRMTSPGIFVDDLGRPSWLPDTRELADLLGVPVTVDAAFARPVVVSGWHTASNLPKPRDFAVAAGSVFVLRFDHDLPGIDGLRRLSAAGLGLRRVEGNGWVSLQRWTPPALSDPAGPQKQADPVHDLFVEITALGIGLTVVDDLRGWAQENAAAGPEPVARRRRLLAKRRYALLGGPAQNAVQRAFELPADQAADLAGRITDWATARTSTRGRRP